jgi:hypothetical protein
MSQNQKHKMELMEIQMQAALEKKDQEQKMELTKMQAALEKKELERIREADKKEHRGSNDTRAFRPSRSVPQAATGRIFWRFKARQAARHRVETEVLGVLEGHSRAQLSQFCIRGTSNPSRKAEGGTVKGESDIASGR